MRENMVYFEIFPWNENFSTGIGSIDDQHKALVNILNKLAAHLANHSNDIMLNNIFDELAEYADYHFKSEEEIWKTYLEDDPWRLEHEQSHTTFLNDVLEIKANKDNKSFDDVVYDLVSFLSQWLAFHILESDKRCSIASKKVMEGMSLQEAKSEADKEMSGSMQIIIKTVLSMYDSLSARTLDLMRERVRRQEAEKALIKEKKNVEQATLAKSEFLSHMSHEIRTPLNAIIGMSYLTLQTDLNEQQKNYLSKVYGSAENLLSLVNDILDFSKIEAGKMELEENPFELKDVINSMMNMINFKAKEKNLKILVKIDHDVPRWLLGDSLRLSQVLINLGTNAVKFSKVGGEIVLKVYLKEENDEEAEILFSVKDEGIGISKEVQKGLFNSFAQADTSTARQYGGSGLGLKISQNICQLMHGEIWVESVPAEGSTFTFSVRLKKQNESMITQLNNQQSNVDGISVTSLQNSNMLVVEDNDLNQELITDLLVSQGVHVSIAENGKEALEVLNEKEFDLILMDVQMPVMNGYEATRQIRLQDKFKSIPVLALTAGLTKEDIEEINASGMDDYIGKPINPKKMFATLEKYLGENRA